MSGSSHSDDLPTHDPLALDRYAAGESDPAERELVERWLAVDPSRTELVAALQRAQDTVEASRGSRTPAERWERLAHAMAAGPEVRPTPRVIKLLGSAQGKAAPGNLQRLWPPGVGGIGGRMLPIRRGRLLAARAIAATILVAIGVGLVFRRSLIPDPRSLTPAAREYATMAGQRLSVTLVDGTRLTLAPASRVRVAAGYGGGGQAGGSKTRPYNGAREVELEGEAYFVVVHDAAHPFAVRTRGAVVRDVGTAFDVRAYPEDAGARVAVADGVVAVVRAACGGPPRCGAQVHAGDVATVDSDRVAVTHRGDVGAYVAWMQGGLVFRDTPLRDVARDLGRTFDLDVTVGDSVLGSRRVTATFGDEPEDEVLDAVAQIVGGRCERTGRKVVIRPYHGAADWQQPTSPMPVATAQARPTA